jgi:uncharacterized DUF497 family protein
VHEGFFDWDGGNEDHVLAHGVAPVEVEEALLDPKGLRADARNAPGEKRFAFLGSTEEERILFIVYAERDGKVRPITARDANVAQKHRYGRGGR